MVPTLEKGVYARRRWVRHWSKVDRHPMIQRHGKKIDGRWPTMNQMIHHVLCQGPLGTDYLVGLKERVGNYVVSAHHKLGQKKNLLTLCPPEQELSLLVQETRVSSALLANISQSCGVVGKHPDRRPRELTLKVLKTQANGPQLPEIDRQADLFLRPPAGVKLVTYMGAPTFI